MRGFVLRPSSSCRQRQCSWRAVVAPPLRIAPAVPPRRRLATAPNGRRAARCSRRQRRGTRTSSTLPVRSDSANYVAASARPADARSCTPTSAAAATTGSRSWSSPRPNRRVPIHYTAYGDESDPGPVPDPADRAGRRRREHTATATCSSCSATRASLRARARVLARRPLGRRRRRELGPASNALRPRGVDVGRRRGTADPSGSRALRRGRERCDQPRAALHRADQSQRGYIFPATHYASFEHRPDAAADGAAAPAQGDLRSLAVHTARRW